MMKESEVKSIVLCILKQSLQQTHEPISSAKTRFHTDGTLALAFRS